MRTVHVYDVEGNSTCFEEVGEFDIFRKVLDLSDSSSFTEYTIALRLLENPQPNVVKIYNVFRDGQQCHIDMELLDDHYLPVFLTANDFQKALQQLHGLGVVYVDIKSDNIGYSQVDRVYKVFDFDCSGVVSNECPKKWLHQPCECFMYKKVSQHEADVKDLFELDNLAWDYAYGKR
jgi:serine/threonine protein kinase